MTARSQIPVKPFGDPAEVGDAAAGLQG